MFQQVFSLFSWKGFQVLSLGTNTSPQPCTPLIDCLVDGALSQLRSDRYEALLQVIDVSYWCRMTRSCIKPQILYSTGLRSGEFADQRSGPINSAVSRRSNATVSRARCAGAVPFRKTWKFPDMYLIAGSMFCFNRQDIPVVCTINHYCGFNKEQLCSQPSCEIATNTMTERLKVERARSRRLAPSSRFLLDEDTSRRSFWSLIGGATVNTFSYVNKVKLMCSVKLFNTCLHRFNRESSLAVVSCCEQRFFRHFSFRSSWIIWTTDVLFIARIP